jgi:NAD(P)-dependent dehydrogenase (short-subunit alcohol dehydrogenase family)
MEKLSGKTALVTGSTDGVGRLVARKLGQAGARVLVHGRDAKRALASSPTSRPAAAQQISLRPTSPRLPRCVASPTRPRRRWIAWTS